MKIYLFDSIEAHENLLPLSFTRPIADFRCGILTISEKWPHYIGGDYHFLPVEYLREKFGSTPEPDEEALFIAGNLLPDRAIAAEIQALSTGQALSDQNPDQILAFRGTYSDFLSKNYHNISAAKNPTLIHYLFDLFLLNGDEIKKDFSLITANRQSAPIPPHIRLIVSKENTEANSIFIEPGATVECASINLTDGPVYIGKDAEVLEGACIRGPFAICQEAEVRMGAMIYEATTIGPHCKVGGEVCNTIFFGYSNKAHDGYLGNAIIGEWCNIGAGTNASNLKNDYSLIRVWNYRTRSFMRTNLQFCGLIMGDHSKIGVNCMVNTATVIGVGVNLHGAGFPRTFIPCFCEGSPGGGFTKVPMKKFLDTASRVMSRRDLTLTPTDTSLLTHIYENS
ncbi:MAG: glucose-1-phosphate thymidylyltransferase [Muribaculaceae bacterium]|nr:glucose-1-phosphate thymidylyltransferase [Muribaculaceae bacterium]